MDEFEYLKNSDEETILNTWTALGEITVTKNTKVYTRGSVIRIDASLDGSQLSKSPLHNKILYVLEDYRVDGKTRGLVDWSQLSPDSVNGMRVAVQGIQLPYFGILNAKWSSMFVPDQNFIPYKDDSKLSSNFNGGIVISDDELETILTVIGFPFASFDDVEFSKEQIIKYMIKPAMQRFFTFRPIVKEEGYGNVAIGHEFLMEFPENAFGCIPYYCVPGGGMLSGPTGGPFAHYNEVMTYGGGVASSRYGRGLKYPGKMVPGFVGLDYNSTMLDQMLANQGMLNVFRREKVSKVKIDGRMFAKGFTTVGGLLNIKWLCWSNNWDDIEFSDLETIARPMARSEVLRNFGLLRSLCKTDIGGQLDPTALKELRNEIEEQLKPIINSIGITGSMALLRGGGN